MTVIATIPVNNFLGTRQIPATAMGEGATALDFVFDGSTMLVDTCLLTLTIDLSIDGGATWASDKPAGTIPNFPITQTMVAGGSIDHKHGDIPYPQYSIGTGLPFPELATRRVKGTATVSGTSLTTVITVVVSP